MCGGKRERKRQTDGQMDRWTDYRYVHISAMCRDQETVLVPGAGLTGGVGHLMWVLATERGSTARAGHALNCCAFPAALLLPI